MCDKTDSMLATDNELVQLNKLSEKKFQIAHDFTESQIVRTDIHLFRGGFNTVDRIKVKNDCKSTLNKHK